MQLGEHHRSANVVSEVPRHRHHPWSTPLPRLAGSPRSCHGSGRVASARADRTGHASSGTSVPACHACRLAPRPLRRHAPSRDSKAGPCPYYMSARSAPSGELRCRLAGPTCTVSRPPSGAQRRRRTGPSCRELPARPSRRDPSRVRVLAGGRARPARSAPAGGSPSDHRRCSARRCRPARLTSASAERVKHSRSCSSSTNAWASVIGGGGHASCRGFPAKRRFNSSPRPAGNGISRVRSARARAAPGRRGFQSPEPPCGVRRGGRLPIR